MKQNQTSLTSDTPSHTILMQAAEWYACLRDGNATAQQQADWQLWLQQDAMHGTAWRYVQEISHRFEPVRSLHDPRSAADQLSKVNERLHKRRHVLAGLGVIASGSVLAWLSWRESWLPAPVMALGADYSTGTGEQRQLQLADGSKVWLNTASALDVRFNLQERRIVLLSGEIFIETAQENARPFMVETPHGNMRALGTRFNVRLDATNTQLAVYEGAVQIYTSASSQTVVLQAGKQASFDRTRIHQPVQADWSREAWPQGMFVADSISLREVVQELRRYRKGYLGIDEAVADLTVYGSFPIHDTDQVLTMLASALPIRIKKTLPWWTSIEAAS